MGIYQFDHLVHFVKDPLQTMKVLKDIGLHAVEGGRHESYGTYNSLSYFDLSYIEIIGVFNQELVEEAAGIEYSLRESFVHNNYSEGLTRVAIRTEDIEADAKRFRDLGLEVNGPLPLSRKRPDGKLITWRLLYIGSKDHDLEMPFFIQWDDEDEVRKEELIDQSVIAGHGRGDLELSSIGFTVHDVEETIKKWCNCFNLEASDIFVDKELNAKGQALLLDGGNLVFYSPLGEGTVKTLLDERGEIPFIADFSGSAEKEVINVFGALYRFK
ncbi:VOC family protein [Cytobacillus purgationiresistens]|uniref:Catechol 2,3-dioxygenase-like lactoylglutathione lyase family enzyme n=1 Tax=Cytobacillus purgationiresistens TaxID=863449 RepID=A0ABU0AMK0_9BACI|nr:VOC family protein [Cytobacillus purgationiresistens]MDQ0272488.1 catechol 2,3-dioxygenase-like lactoylglutathione lyase family enzyme [Cytobacillus purgationiresistens]